MNYIEDSELEPFAKADCTSLHLGGITHADAIVRCFKDEDKIMNILEMGAVDTILITEGIEHEDIAEKAKDYGTNIEIVSKDTREGEQLFQLGGIAAILRYKV